jgi:hypothetical protein
MTFETIASNSSATRAGDGGWPFAACVVEVDVLPEVLLPEEELLRWSFTSLQNPIRRARKVTFDTGAALTPGVLGGANVQAERLMQAATRTPATILVRAAALL